MPLHRVRVAWTNWPGAPGLSTHYLSTAITDMTPIKNFYTAIKDLFPTNLTFVIPNNGDIIEEAHGQLSGVWTGTGGGSVISAATNTSYAGAAGSMLRWQTGGIVNGNRVVGRTYLVPMHQNAYFTDGSLTSSTISTIQAAGQALLAAYTDGLKVWARPTPPNAPGTPRVGGIHTVTSCLVPDLCVVMRSRRI